MPRNFYINGPALVLVKGNPGTGIAGLTELGLSDAPIIPSLHMYHEDIQVNAWGGKVGPEIQWFLGEMTIPITFVHFDPTVLEICLGESMGGAPAPFGGTMQRAGARMGNSLPRNTAGNHFISLNITSPDGGTPWRFPTCYLHGDPYAFPLGTEKTIVTTLWRAIPYPLGATADPYGANGIGATGVPLFDHVLDT